MAAMEEQRFDLPFARDQLPRSVRRTMPVYDKLLQSERYYQVLSNADLAALQANESALRNVNGLAMSQFVVRLNDQSSAVIFGENVDDLQKLIRLYKPGRLPASLVKNYLAQMCAICIELHAKNRVLQGALQLSSFCKEATDRIFLMSTLGVQVASEWVPQKVNPIYLAPEVLPNPTACDMFTADAYSVGICGLILATGQPPFRLPYSRGFTAVDLLSGKYSIKPDVPDDLDKELSCLLLHLLDRSPEKRMRLTEATLHPALRCYMNSHMKNSSPAVAAIFSRHDACRNSNPPIDGSETSVVDYLSFAADTRAFTRSPTPPLNGLDATSEPYCLWLANPAGDINENSDSDIINSDNSSNASSSNNININNINNINNNNNNNNNNNTYNLENNSGRSDL